MADVTDAPFRRLLAKYSRSTQDNSKTAASESALQGASPSHTLSGTTVSEFWNPYVMWTEFVAADGLVRATPEGKEKLMADLIYSEAERPIVAQLFSSTPEHMEYAAKLCHELGFDGVDINMGCPDRSIEKQGCGAAMIKTPNVAVAIIEAAKRGAQFDTENGIPVSVKTRIGYFEDEIDTWIPTLLKAQPAALTVHLRTRKQMSKVPAQWEKLPKIVAMRDELSPETIIIGNGDVLSKEDGLEKIADSGADGVMVGRALFGNPWFFHPTRRLPTQLTALPTKGVNRETIVEAAQEAKGFEFVSLEERLSVLVEHSYLFEELLPFKNFSIMKKHYKAYVNGFPGAAELRNALMQKQSAAEVEVVIENFLRK